MKPLSEAEKQALQVTRTAMFKLLTKATTKPVNVTDEEIDKVKHDYDQVIEPILEAATEISEGWKANLERYDNTSLHGQRFALLHSDLPRFAGLSSNLKHSDKKNNYKFIEKN